MKKAYNLFRFSKSVAFLTTLSFFALVIVSPLTLTASATTISRQTTAKNDTTSVGSRLLAERKLQNGISSLGQLSDELSALSSLLAGREGGEYLWIPDSMMSEVTHLLKKGYASTSQTSATLNTSATSATSNTSATSATSATSNTSVVSPTPPNSQLTLSVPLPATHFIFRGDTIPALLRTRNIGRYSRGLKNHLYIPKGYWQFGLTASYGEFSSDNLELFSLLSNVDLGGHIFSIKPSVAYFVRNNLSIGLRLGYTSGKATIKNFKVDIDEDMNFNLHDISYRDESYSAAAVMQQYVGLGHRGRFAVFNEVELAFASGNTRFIRPFNEQPKTTATTYAKASLNFSPGLSVAVMQNVAFNVSFGVFGFSLKNEKQTVDGIPAGNRFTSGVNFRFNIFNINFGIAVNL